MITKVQNTSGKIQLVLFPKPPIEGVPNNLANLLQKNEHLPLSLTAYSN